ncbi:uncharacterized protein LOC126849950 [Cataglyphis hispanica]|uniref:uncharacterized protein LOC126849950 n=1 Tax=Cataglyphis hispanica TaxID=1086592 RepID=UPI00217FE44F|nr:uncharacterized protein LOC126849950 [Cataglyphis hispanica]
MLCCVPKSFADGDPFHDETPFHNETSFHDETLFHDKTLNKTPLSICKTWVELYSEEDAPPPILLPCAICARTFMPQSLEKHTKICERSTVKKRKPFDSAKQRIQGTELAEFLPKQEPRRHHQDEKTTKSSWKKTHDDFLKTIREARGEVMDSSNKQCNSVNSSGAPTRANEKGTCPTCNRQFGIKAYDRHVAWCKDRITQMPMSPATNLAKERLEARMRYKAPVFKNRRAINREKYSPGSAVNQSVKISVSSPALVKPKESVSVTNGSRHQSPMKQKPAVVKRPGQLKESPISSGPMKSRLIDRTNNLYLEPSMRRREKDESFLLLRPAEAHDILTSTSCQTSHFAISSRRPLQFPVSTKSRINSDSVSSNEITSPTISFRKQFDRNEKISHRIPNDETRTREICSIKMQKNIVSARSQGHPTINDIAVNDKTLGMIVQPYKIHMDLRKDDQLVTWKQISKKNNLQCSDSVVSFNSSQEFSLLELDRRCDREDEINTIEKEDRTEKELLIAKNDFTQINDELGDSEVDTLRNDKLIWSNGIQNLNQTYLIKDSEDIYNEPPKILHSKWKPIKHSPRIEFYFNDIENENVINKTKSDRKTIASDEEIRTTKQELQMEIKNIENKENTETKVMEQKVEKLKTDNEDRKDWKINDKEAEVIERKIKKFNINIENKDNQRLINEEDEIAGYDVKKLEINIKDKRDSQRMDDTDIAEFDKLDVNKENKKDKQIAIDIIEDIKYTVVEENEQNLLNFDTLSQFSQDAEESFKKSKVSSTDSNNDFILNLFQNVFETSLSKHEDPILHVNNKNSLTVSNIFINNHIEDDLNLKNKMLQYESDTCCNLQKLQENVSAFICNQSHINNMMFLNSNNQTDSEVETLPCQSNVICSNSDLKENIKVMPSVSSRASLDKDSTKNTEETEINDEICGNGLIILYNNDSERNLKELNSEISLSHNSEILANESHTNAYTNNISLQVKVNRQYQEQFFDSDNFENIEDCLKNEKTDFDANIDRQSNNKSSRSIIQMEITTSEGLHKRNVDNEEFNYGSDNIVCVEEHDIQDADDLVSSVTLKNNVETQYRHDETFLKASVNFSKDVPDSARRLAKERPVNSVKIKHKIRESMNRLRGSTDSLISSIEFIDLENIRRPKVNYAYEQESIEIIRPKRNRVFRGLPDIRNDLAETREDSEKSYWEKASKISRNRLIDLNSIPARYKFVKRNPRVRILPPVSSPSLMRRKIELATRPAWCNYVRRRPDFNLVLKARTGTSKDYDPFLLAEQQMKDLLSDMSDQSVTGSPKLQQTHDNLYPLSHSSAFVKYPISHKRSSLIEPPIEFDDIASDFSSDSTETNSISREIFLSKPVLRSKDVTDVADLKPIKELGRRVIIDKSKALGVDERRGVIGSADRSRKIFDKVTPMVTKSLIDRSNSIRVSSAPKTNSNFVRKISNDVRKVQDSMMTEDQSLSRSSDQSLNQSNNNYSSLSGSNLSLNSIISSSEFDVKRSNSMFDELTCFKEDEFNLKSFLNNESFDLSSCGGDRQRNDSLISDGELSSPDSYKPRDHSKLSNDSAYSSLNRKYSHHGRSTNDVIGRLDEDVPVRNETSPTQTTIKCKLSKFCHECGQRFPETAKFCCECGVRRLAL